MIVDLFAGPGGWDVAARWLGMDPLGVEMDDAARATRKAAGLTTSFGRDVAKMDLATWSDVEGTIASPPCQTFSMAGKGAGRAALDQVLLGIKRLCVEGRIPYEEYDDARTGLVLEPLRYALELEPEWLAWEQVPTVQPVWDACADVLREEGYSVWTGHLHAETYGVPQTRKRSVLIASRSREMSKPPVTHSRFYPRSPAKLDDGVAKWVSMAEALGWGMTRRPSMTFAGAGATSEQTAGQPRSLDLPARTITGKGTAAWKLPDGREPWKWAHTPSTTIAGDPRITAREHHYHGEQNKTSYRVTVQEAAVLQSFPPDYPWQGSKTKQYQQVGNAFCPRAAVHVLAMATGLPLPSDFIADATEETS